MTPALELFIFTFAAFGFCWAVGHSKPTLPLRTWLARATEVQHNDIHLGETDDRQVMVADPSLPAGGRYVAAWLLLVLMECPACLGFHVGWIAHVTGRVHVFSSWYMAAFYVCAINFILGKFTGLIVEE